MPYRTLNEEGRKQERGRDPAHLLGADTEQVFLQQLLTVIPESREADVIDTRLEEAANEPEGQLAGIRPFQRTRPEDLSTPGRDLHEVLSVIPRCRGPELQIHSELSGDLA